MIPVQQKPEPANFDKKVRQKGLTDLQRRGVSLHLPAPKKFAWKPFWTDCLDDLYREYDKTCSYGAVYFERILGAGTVDHHVAKSKLPSAAYEWSNYRLACAALNSRKWRYDDILDPFEIQSGWFHLELVSGHIYANPALAIAQKKKITRTITRLNLDDAGWQELRARHYSDYIQGYYTADFLRMRSPFVYAEALRQGLL